MKKLNDLQAEKLSNKEMQKVSGGAWACATNADCGGGACIEGLCRNGGPDCGETGLLPYWCTTGNGGDGWVCALGPRIAQDMVRGYYGWDTDVTCS